VASIRLDAQAPPPRGPSRILDPTARRCPAPSGPDRRPPHRAPAGGARGCSSTGGRAPGSGGTPRRGEHSRVGDGVPARWGHAGGEPTQQRQRVHVDRDRPVGVGLRLPARRVKSARPRRRVQGEPIERRAQWLVVGQRVRLEGREATHPTEARPAASGPRPPKRRGCLRGRPPRPARHHPQGSRSARTGEGASRCAGPGARAPRPPRWSARSMSCGSCSR